MGARVTIACAVELVTGAWGCSLVTEALELWSSLQPTALARSHMLYCALTGQLLEKALAAVKKHMGGKRFVRAKERYLTDKQDLKPEPSLREFGIILVGWGSWAEVQGKRGLGHGCGMAVHRSLAAHSEGLVQACTGGRTAGCHVHALWHVTQRGLNSSARGYIVESGRPHRL